MSANPRALPGSAGFTLIELAIVLFVVTLLLGGVLTPLGQQIAERQSTETRRSLDLARTALVGYALEQHDWQTAPRERRGPGRLPCPDLRMAGPGGTANDGFEDRLPDGGCAAAIGNLPWMTLGVAEIDAWGNRLGYAVASNWSADTMRPGVAASPTIEICRDSACAQPMAAAALLISHGRNGFGASNASGGVNLAPASADEQENADGDLRFIMRPPRAGDRPGGEYDDLLLALSPHWLRGRLCDPASVC